METTMPDCRWGKSWKTKWTETDEETTDIWIIVNGVQVQEGAELWRKGWLWKNTESG